MDHRHLFRDVEADFHDICNLLLHIPDGNIVYHASNDRACRDGLALRAFQFHQMVLFINADYAALRRVVKIRSFYKIKLSSKLIQREEGTVRCIRQFKNGLNFIALKLENFKMILCAAAARKVMIIV